MNKGLDWVHHDSKTFDEEQFMENIERKYIEKHKSHIEGFTKDYVDKLLEEKDKEIERLNNIINELEIFLNKVASTSTGETITCNNILKYLQELKENNKK